MSGDDALREAMWEAVATVRDASPRRTEDADTYDVVDAVLALPEVAELRAKAADCFPLDDDVSPQLMAHWLDLYEAGGSTCRYEFEGKRYLHVLNWSDHQKPQHPSKARIVPCPKHEIGAHRTWLEVRAAEHAKVSGNPHEGLVSVSPTSRGGGEVSLEMSEGDEGGPSSGAVPTAPPLYPDRCTEHANDPAPGNCGNCADVRKANKANAARPLALVRDTKRCLVHDQTYTTVCSGCRADQIAYDEETA